MKGSNNTPRTRKVKESLQEGKHIKEKFVEQRAKEIESKPIQAKNEFQKKVLQSFKAKQITVVIAPAGTGKSLMAMGTASDWYVKGIIKKIIISRPAVGMGRTLGLLKGSLEDKFNPYLAPLIEVFTDRHGRGRYEIALNSGDLEMIPMEYLRGRNIRDVAIVDEAQNLTQDEVFSLLTRITEEGKLFLIGDPTQNDLKQESGLVWLEKFVIKHDLQDYIDIITATSDEIVRSGLCKSFVKAMEVENDR